MYKLQLKPLSVNRAWLGRKVKSKEYRLYEEQVITLLPNKIDIPVTGPLKLTATVGYSSKLADIDNFLKPFIDCLQKKYNFNDKDIYQINVTKEIVTKGNEYISFSLKPYTPVKPVHPVESSI